MGQIVIRDIPDDVMQAIDVMAGEQGIKGRETFIRMLLVKATEETRKEIKEQKEIEMGKAQQLKASLETFLKSDDFTNGVVSATRAGWGGSGYSVELYLDGDHRVLWNNQIGNLYQSPGVILSLPQVSDIDDMASDLEEQFGEYSDEQENDYIKEAFSIHQSDAEDELRESLEYKLRPLS